MLRRLIALVIVVVAAAAVLFYALGPKRGRMLVSNPTAVAHMGHGGMVDVYFSLENPGGPDALVSASLPSGGTVAIRRPEGVDVTPIPAGASPVFSSDSIYLTVSGLDTPLEPGTLIPVELGFEKSGNVTFKARVGNDAGGHAAHSAHMAGTEGPVPQVSMTVTAQGSDGPWDVALSTQNIEFVKVEDGTPDSAGTGHAHLYLNGLKLGRLYSTSATIGKLLPGTYSVKVALNSNSHRPYTDDGKPVAATATITSE